MSVSVLYISYTGLLDPLGQSQVLQYVLRLAEEHRMTLLTFEKPAELRDAARVHETRRKCELAGVQWHYLRYHNRPNLAATFYDVLCGILEGQRLARQNSVQVVHCRSYLAGLMGLAVKQATGVRYIFDMRGFWPDERVDGGVWRRGSMRYRLFKWLERKLFLAADQVVSLTRAGVREIEGFSYLQGRLPPVAVVPTCTNLELFHLADMAPPAGAGFVLGYIGSVGTWYMFDEVARVVRMLFEQQPDARFLVINKGGHDVIRHYLSAAGVDLARVEIKAVPYDQVSVEVGRMDAGIFFIKPVWSKRASCPTRMGEFLACGKPCLANGGVGDVEEILSETGTGITINEFGEVSLKRALEELVDLARQPGIARRCRRAAEERFSLAGGAATYSAIYRALSGTTQSISHPRPIKVLFLTRYPVEGASSRYRVFQYLPHLEALGVHCTVQTFMDGDMYRLSFSPGSTVKKVWLTLCATLRRLQVLRNWRRYHVIYLQRELFPFGPPWIERLLKGAGAVMLYDYDDALFIKKPSRYNPLATLFRSPTKTLELFRQVDCVVAGNDWLRDRAIAEGGRAVTVEVAEDTQRIKMHRPHDNSGPITVGWLGSKSTVKYLKLIEPVLQELARNHSNLRFEIMGGGEFDMPGIPWVHSEWSLDAELLALQGFDIGLMPLPREEWANGKSGGKARTYMAAGVVPVCEDIGYNRELIRHGETGFLCSTLDEWRSTLELLIADPELRQRVATAARHEVETRFSLEGQAKALRSVFDMVLAHRAARSAGVYEAVS